MKILALDIGGANIKIAVLEDNRIQRNSIYFPFWKRKNEFGDFLFKILKKTGNFDAVGITMTAELSDAYKTKGEGVRHILSCVEKVTNKKILQSKILTRNTLYYDKKIYVLSNNGELLSITEARKNPYSVASANWTATALYVAKNLKTRILIDIGSTTTDIIPVKNGKILARGRNDTERLQNDELLYMGALRTNVAAIIDSVPVNGKKTGIASEFFANTADVYRILGDITEKQYSCETADGRGKSKKECMARLARIVCADINTISETGIKKIADYIKERQIENISNSIKKILQRKILIRNTSYYDKKISRRYKIKNAIITGTGKFIACDAVRKAGITEITELGIDPSLALAFMIRDNYLLQCFCGTASGVRRPERSEGEERTDEAFRPEAAIK